MNSYIFAVSHDVSYFCYYFIFSIQIRVFHIFRTFNIFLIFSTYFMFFVFEGFFSELAKENIVEFPTKHKIEQSTTKIINHQQRKFKLKITFIFQFHPRFSVSTTFFSFSQFFSQFFNLWLFWLLETLSWSSL